MKRAERRPNDGLALDFQAVVARTTLGFSLPTARLRALNRDASLRDKDARAIEERRGRAKDFVLAASQRAAA